MVETPFEFPERVARFVQSGELFRAREILTGWVQRGPFDARTCEQLGQVLRRMGDSPKPRGPHPPRSSDDRGLSESTAGFMGGEVDGGRLRRVHRCSRDHLLLRSRSADQADLAGLEDRSVTLEKEKLVTKSQLLRFQGAVRRDARVDAWMHEHAGELGTIARRWFDVMRGCGEDVRELLHDGHPTACIADAAFAYVNAFSAHVNVGFFRGAEIPDPKRLLEGTGRFMRHVKLRPEREVDATALTNLIETAYTDMRRRLKAE